MLFYFKEKLKLLKKRIKMKVKIKISDWEAGIPVIMLRKKTAEKLGVHPKQRLLIKNFDRKPKQIYAIVDVFEKILKEDEVAISLGVKKALGVKTGEKIDISLASPPKSLDYIKEKLENKDLSKEKIFLIIKDIVGNNLSEPEIALFVSGMYDHGMNFDETVSLIKAILNSGKTISFGEKLIADKHCIGGIAGNRTTPLIVSICASQGLIMPKSSSRAITSAAGTADVIETLTQVDLEMNEVKKIVKKIKACLVWGGGLGMVSADSKIIEIEKELRIDPEAQLLASVMAKKIAVGSKYLLLDIPYGKFAKVNKTKAKNLKVKFEKLGKYFGIKTRVVLTKGNAPIGKGIGPVLEMIDVLKILNPKEKGPEDLRRKAIFLSGELFEMTKICKKGKGKLLAKKALDSGQAYEKFREIIEAQGGKIRELKPSKFEYDLIAKRSSRIKKIHNKKINQLARLAGCPLDKAAGVYLHKALGQKINKGEKILTVYAESRSRLGEAINFLEEEKPIEI